MKPFSRLIGRVARRPNFSLAGGSLRELGLIWSGTRSQSGPFPVEYWRLRRNIHRLEKALTHRPLRTPFASRYLAVTLRDYETLAQVNRYDASIDGLVWARSVLVEVLGVLGDEDTLAALPEVSISEAPSAERTANQLRPYRRGDRAMVDAPMAAVMTSRRSTRWFLQKPVDREIVEKCVLLASEAPSACNRQPFRIDLVAERELKQRIVDLAPGTSGFGNQIPLIGCVVGDFSAFEQPRDRRLPYIDGSLFAMQLMLALESHDYASCPINWPELPSIDSTSRRLLNLNKWEKIIMLMAIGIPDPDGFVPGSPKRQLGNLRRWV